ncbi:autotransporter outer membrane beta-barrel domain-containing protein [Kaistia defluvii]|uniref:Outer membrane autotransporter protein n=1 Tax=Kaistia defluvii TaxID=410841 RepID=A0ABV2QUL3_9HYPH
MASYGLDRAGRSAPHSSRARWAAGASLVALATVWGGDRASADPSPIFVETQADLDGLLSGAATPGVIRVSPAEPLVLINADAVTFSDTIALDGVSWINPYGTFTKAGAGTLTLDGATITGGEAYVAGGTVNFTGNNNVDYFAVGAGTTQGTPNTGAMTIGDGATVAFGIGLSVGYYGGIGTVDQTGGTVTISPTCASEANCAAAHIGNQGGQGTYTISGGLLEVNDGRMTLGRNTTSTEGTSGTLNIEGGTVSIQNSAYLAIGFGRETNDPAADATGEINQSGGTLRVDGTSSLFLAGTGTGTYNLDGGTLEIGGTSLKAHRVNGQGSYTFNLGGGSIRVIGSNLDTSVDATLQSETETVFDTNGYNANWAGSMSGTGALFKAGAGTLSIGNLSTSDRTVIVDAGDIALAGNKTFIHSTIGINAGSTLNVGGNATIDSNSSFITVIDDSGLAGKITATGDIYLGGTLFVGSNGYIVGEEYEIARAGGTATEALSGVVEEFEFLRAELSNSTHSIYLTLVQDVNFATAADTSNQAAAADGLESVGSGALFDAVRVLDNQANVPAAFDAISGEIHASSASALLNESFFLRDAVLGRLQYPSKSAGAPSASLASGYAEGEKRSAAPFPGASAPAAETGTFWSQAYGAWGHSDGDANVAKLNRSTGGVLVGYDHSFGQDWLIGAAAGYSRTSFDLDDRASSGDSNNYHLLAYAGGKVSDVNVRLGASYSWNEVDTTRHVSIPGFFETETADYSAGTAQVFGELGYDVAVSAATTIEPFAGLAYVHLSTDGYGETGGSAALNVDGANQSVTYGTLGLRAEHKVVVGNVGVTLQGSAAWQHAWGDVTPVSTLAFAGGDAFQVTGAPIAKDAALIKAGFDVDVAAGAKLGLFYAGQIASDAADNSVQGRLSIAF